MVVAFPSDRKLGGGKICIFPLIPFDRLFFFIPTNREFVHGAKL